MLRPGLSGEHAAKVELLHRRRQKGKLADAANLEDVIGMAWHRANGVRDEDGRVRRLEGRRDRLRAARRDLAARRREREG